MFSKSANFYDEIYAAMDKDYAAEAKKAHQIIKKYKRSSGKRLLDMACGTGLHADKFNRFYQVEGLDLDPAMLSVARKNYPAIQFHRGDMVDFNIHRQFDIIICLFSSIGYVKTKARLFQSIQSMNRHLALGGVLLVEPWFSPKQWKVGHIGTILVEKPDHKIVRMSRSARQGKLSTIEFEYLIGTPKGIDHRSEVHELGLFTHEEYMEAFRRSGLEVIHDPEGLDGRGLYIGLKPTG
jgi:SAM-dependent methyltransferase